MPVTFIGDVHGWSRRLDQVLAKALGEVVLMGDLIDRGPDAPGVLKRVHELCRSGRARCLLGNHEYALLRGIGVPSIGLGPDPERFELWRDHHGGSAVLNAYGARDAAALRRALGERMIAWLASLPWYLRGENDRARWIAVHAAIMPGSPLVQQLELLADGWNQLIDHPHHLYDKAHVQSVPDDLPPGTVLVSGHLPLVQAVVTPARILCDTSGGLPGRRLTGVIWPEGRIITSD